MKYSKHWQKCAMALFFLCPFAIQAQTDIEMEQDIVKYINQYRISHHLKPLRYNAIIANEARKHSQDMARHRIAFGHQYFNDRIKRIYKHIDKPMGGAENVAYNYKTARIVVDGWLKSRGHKRNIDGNYNLTGVGIARDAFGKIYFTQMFIRAG